MTAGAATNFVKRQMLGRAVGQWGGINTRPELLPSDDIQAKMNDMSIQGGGEIYLGPYEYRIESKAQNDTDAATEIFWTVPENVTLIGVPNKTIIYKTAYYEESFGNSSVNIKSLGPVVSLGGNGSSIIGCTVYLDLYSNRIPGESRGANFANDGAGGIALNLPGSSSRTGIPRKNTCVIYVGGTYERRKIQDCTIGSPSIDKTDQDYIGVHLDNTSYSKTLIAKNYFLNNCGSVYDAGVYFEDGTKDNAIVANIASTGDSDFVSIEDAASLALNVVSGNVPSTAASTTSYGLRT